MSPPDHPPVKNNRSLSSGPAAELYGLVLAGGRSTRMGTDKGLLNWQGKPHRYYLADLLKGFCKEAFISCRSDQKHEIDDEYQTIEDSLVEMGPFGGLYAAFERHPDCAWLVLACDLPFVNTQILNHLIQQRAAEKMATTYINPSDRLPEPLLTIWEPLAFKGLIEARNSGNFSLRKLLLNENIKLIPADDARLLSNVNTPEEVRLIRKD
jgi:molybdopterin-guanine dinucleotide biosynthesis protein A